MAIAAVLQPSAAGAKAVRGMYLKISTEKKAKIGQRAEEQGVLAMVRYYATKLWFHAFLHCPSQQETH